MTHCYEGWLRQLHRSAGGDDKFILNAALFAPQKKKRTNEIQVE